MTEWWRPTFQTTVEAYYRGDLAAGLHACELLNALEGLPAKTEQRARQNLPFYTPALAGLAPSTTSRRIEIPVAANWSCHNPSLAAADDGFRMIVRSANYRVDPPLRYTYYDPDGIVRTTNYLLDLAPDLAIRRVTPIDDRAFRPDPPRYLVAGYEDCRLFRHRDAWWYTATVRDRDAGGVCRVGLVRMDGETVAEEHLLSDGQGSHEKNWMPVTGDDILRFVHSCSPVTVLRYCDETGRVRDEVQNPSPSVARRFRGGSQAIPVNGGHLSLVHEVVWPTDGGRIYLHRWVWFDQDWRLASMSVPFTMRERGIEFAAGLAQQGDNLIISYGVWDREAWLSTVPLAEVLPLLAAPLTSAEAEARIRDDAADSPDAQAVSPVPAVQATPPPAPPVATLPANAAAEWWRPEFQITVDAYARGDLTAGRLACERLLSVDAIPDWIDNLVHQNLSFYTDRLHDLAPSFTAKRIELQVRPNWSAFNPSIAADGAGFRVIVRSSNYRYDGSVMAISVEDDDRIIRTENYLLTLTADLESLETALVCDDPFRPDPPPFHVSGFEDCRLFQHRGAWWMSATVRDRSPRGTCQIAMLLLDGTSIVDICLLSDDDGNHEKNWMPVTSDGDAELRFVHSCSPTVILHYDESGSVSPELIQPAPRIARRFSGGTQLIPIEGGHLCLIHEAVRYPNGDRFYIHRWIGFDINWQISRLSPPFVFHDRGVEFAAGLARRGDDLVISYGVWDREAWIATLRFDEVLSLLAPPLDPDETASQMRSAQVVDWTQATPTSGQSMSATGADPTIVSTTLAGNSADVVADALRSVAEWVDWCLLIDTGVSDETIDVAREIAGEKLLVREFPWREDFAAARNFALEAAAELGADWAMTLDTDERIALNGVDIRAALAATTADSLHVEKSGGSYGKERLFRLSTRGHWVGPTHEAYIQRGRSATLPGVRFDELGKTHEQYRQKAERDITILARHTAEHPDDPRWFYYLGDSYAGVERHEDAIAAFRICTSLNGWDEEAAWAMYRSAQCFLRLGRPNEAIGECAVGMGKHPGLPDLPWLAAYAAWQAGNAAHAAYWARHAIALGHFAGVGASVPRISFRYPPATWEGPYDVLRFALRKLGDDTGADEAEQLFRQASLARRDGELT